jgi:hypothetical protein
MIAKGSIMSDWSIQKLLSGLHKDIEQKLRFVRETLEHPGTKGDASETIWREFLDLYLPRRYSVETGHVVDSLGNFSQQIDVIVFDRQYSPFLLNFNGTRIVPAESVYAIFEGKQAINAQQVDYAKKKIASVRALERTSLPIPHAGGVYPAKAPPHIIGGLLTFESDWTPPLGASLLSALHSEADSETIDLGCVAAHGVFGRDSSGADVVTVNDKAATAFLFELLARLQEQATVPMMDIRAYAKWLDAESGLEVDD